MSVVRSLTCRQPPTIVLGTRGHFPSLLTIFQSNKRATMAVDHGLEGRNSEKSRQRRERKAKRLRKMVQASLKAGDAGGRRGEVKFDETARQAWLTGFKNRKQERRKYGLTMQMLKEEKLRKEAKKAKILTLSNLHKEDEKGLALRTKKQKRRSLKFGGDEDEGSLSKTKHDEEDDEDKDSDAEEEEAETEEENEEEEQENVFNDEATMNMFGAEVTVVVDQNPVTGQFLTHEDLLHSHSSADSDQEDAASIHSMRSRASQRAQQHQPSRFERAMKKVKASLGNRKKNKAKDMQGKARSLRKKVESKKLFEKALGRKVKRNKNK